MNQKSFSNAMRSFNEQPVYRTRAERLFQQQLGASLAEDIVEKAEFKEAQLERENQKLIS